MASFFEKAIAKNPDFAKIIANFLIVEINAYLNKTGSAMKELPLDPNVLNDIARFQSEGYTHKQCADILSYVLENGGSAEEARVAKRIEKQSDNSDEVLAFVTAVLDANPQSIEDFKAGKDRAKGFLIGQVMKAAKGKVNPAAVAKIMDAELAKR